MMEVFKLKRTCFDGVEVDADADADAETVPEVSVETWAELGERRGRGEEGTVEGEV